jgi:hypothetical protein
MRRAEGLQVHVEGAHGEDVSVLQPAQRVLEEAGRQHAREVMADGDTIEAKISYPDKKRAKQYESSAAYFEDDITFDVVDSASFGSMALAVLKLDDDHCMYALVPVDWLDAEIIRLQEWRAKMEKDWYGR